MGYLHLKGVGFKVFRFGKSGMDRFVEVRKDSGYAHLEQTNISLLP